ncbi:MAG TPA: hypothetical protein VKU00_17890 [Chthonomonadaceae bacterium]|nr:hypothetical protein [Chthonomonadaceae bacterium]
MRHELKHLLGLSEMAVEIVFSPSGTDSTLHALFLARVLSGATPLDTLLLASDETGSGVPDALSGRHFSTMTAAGVTVTKGEPIAGLAEDVTRISLPMRNGQGALRPPACIDQEVLDTLSQSVARGHNVLLQVMDSSKLGGRCPSVDCLRVIQSQFADSVRIVVDACQMRISLARLHWHLDQGHMVLISGSKFFTGPPFSGALLAPEALSHPIAERQRIPSGLQSYTGRSDWPQDWKHIRAALPDRANFGQYFRWTAALDEMRTYFAVPLDFRRAVLQKFAEIATEAICSRYPHALLMEEGDSSSDDIEDAEMVDRTIFPLLLRQGRHWISFEASTKLYQALNQNSIASLPACLSRHERALASKLCHVGQPVRVPCGDREETGVLRICASARTVSEVWSRYRREPFALNMEQERNDLATLLQKIELLSRYSLSIPERAACRHS